MHDEALLASQRLTETQTIDRGRARFEQRTIAKVDREGFDKHDQVQKLIRGIIPILSEGLAEWLEQANAAKGRKSVAVSALNAIDLDAAAAIGSTAIFRAMGDGGRISDIAMTIGRRLEIELEGEALKEADAKGAARFLKLAEGKPSTKVLEDRFKALVDRHEALLHWSGNTRVLVGQAVINVALVKLEEVFATKTIRQGSTTTATIELTDEAAEVLMQMEDHAAMQHLPLRPMVAPPRKWEHLTSGAYYDFKLARLVPMVRVQNKEHRQLLAAAIADGSMQEVLDALNAIQDTRWAVDVRTLAWALWCKDGGVRPSSSFPSLELPAIPEKVEAEAWEAMAQDERTARSRQRRSIKLMRKAMAIDARTFDMDVAEAIHLSTFEAFYLPHSLDFRGRTYAVPYFNHQRSDHLKALFRFADGVPLGEHGGKWLMVHLANTGDFDKMSKKPFEQRVAWVKANEALILATAADPEANVSWWGEADSPFCFLQACFEYAEWAASGYSEDFLSTIPGAADGSCSGLQHYSVITRSADEAYHVNLVPRGDVGDIYQVTADRALPTLQAAASRSVEADDAKGILEREAANVILENGFGRGEVKRNVMTYFYGSARFGMRDQHMQDLMRPLADKVAMGKLSVHPYALMTERTDKETGEVRHELDGGYTCAALLAGHTYAAVTAVAHKADEAATWVQKVAAVLAHEGQSMVWTTPTGFPVVQRYQEYVCKEVNLWLYDRSIRVPEGTDRVDPAGNVMSRVRVLIRQAPTARVDKKAMRNASSPNLIHSMDAAHLHRSVAMGKAAGIEAFSMIHDSFGTHMGKMEQFNGIIREALISCYQDYCPLAELDRNARLVLSEEGVDKLPELPAKGDLDLNLIREAQYAFA